jgi:glyoxylase-like metal-dependent hydrolase (beta-lactamase superfamily II)
MLNFIRSITILILFSAQVVADNDVESILFSKPQQVSGNVWSAIGATAPPTYENSGHNNNLTFIITSEGVVVINAGDNYLLAKSLHQDIKAITEQPVKYVVLENGQGHAALGSNYWKEQGVPIVAHSETKQELEAHGYDSLDRCVVVEKTNLRALS